MTQAQRFEGRAMGSAIALTTIVAPTDEEPSLPERAWSAVTDEFALSEAAMSRFLDTSEVTQLNRRAQRGEPMVVSRRLAIAAQTCDRAHRLTAGRFDPRVIGQLDAWGYAGASLDAPVALETVGAPGRIAERVDRTRIRLDHPIDLGGIGKGLAARWAAARVQRVGVERFLLDAGGDIVARGSGPDGEPWSIGIEDPTGGSQPRAVVGLVDHAIATSSVKRLRWVNEGQVRHHIVDPSTAQPANGGLVAVTVAAPDPAWAEVWSKALFIAGRARIADEARARGLAAWWCAPDGSLEMTPAARACTSWVAGEY